MFNCLYKLIIEILNEIDSIIASYGSRTHDLYIISIAL